MNLFKRLFGTNTVAQKDENDDNGKYMPENAMPLDEKFTVNFKSNGGKFLYCDSLAEVCDVYNKIIIENDWEEKEVLLIDKLLKEKFDSLKLKSTTNAINSTYFFTSCENLIAADGSILISSNQLAEKRLSELPKNFIVFATTSQITKSISEGLRNIKQKGGSKIPTNITTIKHFKPTIEKDFLSYGSSSKNLYLLLLEDL